MVRMRRAVVTISVALLAFAATAAAQVRWDPPEGIDWRAATIYSGGTRLAAEVFSLEANAGDRLPYILMAHGWGGTFGGLRRDAVAFDYRGLGRPDFSALTLSRINEL